MPKQTTNATKAATATTPTVAPSANATKAATATPRATAIAAHASAGFTGTAYAGLSKTRNSGAAHAIDTSTSKATARAYAKLTPRMHATLRELAKAYGDKPFLARGIDRGQAAIFINSGFVVRVGKSGDASGGIYSDGATPLQLRLSADTLKRYT